MTHPLIETVARDLPGLYGKLSRAELRLLAKRAIRAIEASGTHRIVPVELTDEMSRVGYEHMGYGLSFAWPHLLSAAPRIGDET